MKKKMLLAMLGTILLLASGCCIKHDWKDATCTKPMTCRECGKTKGDDRGHDWVDATCTEPKTCEECGKTKGEAIGHDAEDATCTRPSVCMVCGQTLHEAMGHNWTEATCVNPKKCKTCGITEGVAAGHKWEDATCKNPKTCTVCKLTSGSVSNDHTLNAKGKCTVCGKQIGIELTMMNYSNYLSVESKVTSWDYRGFIEQIQITVRSKKANAKFYGAQIQVYYSDGNNGKNNSYIPHKSSGTYYVNLNEKGYGVYTHTYDMTKNMMSRPWINYIQFESVNCIGYVIE